MSKAKSDKNWFQRHKIISVTTGTIVFYIFLFTIIGGGKTDTDTAVDSRNTPQDSTQQQPTQESGSEAKDEYAINETATLDGYELTVTGIERNYSPHDYASPEEGKEYVAVTVAITNTKSREASFNTYDFEIQDSNGVRKSESWVGGEGRLSSGSLASGGTVTGILAYEIPADDSGLKLIYKTNMFSSKNIIVNLGE